MAEDIGGKWLPFVMLHEFETLIIASGAGMPSILGDARAPIEFRRMIGEAGGAELINDGVSTAPSKRVQSVLPAYRKAQDAVAALEGWDFDQVLATCPRFADWITWLRGAPVEPDA